MSISCLKNELFLKKNVEFIFSSFFFTFLLLKQILERHHRKATMEVLLCHLSGALEVCALSLSLLFGNQILCN